MQLVVDADTAISRSISPEYFDKTDVTALALVAQSANDLALIVDSGDRIVDVAMNSDSDAIDDIESWLGMQFIDTVSVESRPKIRALLQVDESKGPSRWRQVSHFVSDSASADVPVLYRAFDLGNGHRLLLGRDLRAVSMLQQELLEVQHSMERDYVRLYQAESRYRMLFQLTAEPILILDSEGRTIQEANPAAANLLERPANKLIGKRLDAFITPESVAELNDHLSAVKALGKRQEMDVQTVLGNNIRLTASVLRQDDSSTFLLQLTPTAMIGSNDDTAHASPVVEVIEQSTDAFVLTDPNGLILTVNDAFLDFCQATSDSQIIDQPLENWLGRPGVDFNVLRKTLLQRGAVRRFSTTINSEFGASVDVSASAVAALEANPPCLGFFLRRGAEPAEPTRDPANEPLGRSLEQMTNLVGRVPLRELVRETTDLIERMCIEAALKLTTNNRASAADMLGLSRQSLYVKLRRYGIGDSDANSDT